MSRQAGIHSAETLLRPDLPDLDLCRQIGKGSYGEVWLATNRTTGRLLAVKLVPLRSGRTSNLASREVSSLTRLDNDQLLNHENLLRVHHVGRTPEFIYYTMDPADDITGSPASLRPTYCPATLARRIQDGPPPVTDAVVWATQLMSGMAHLHQAGMVHRDIKPSNCLLVGGVLKLADFGLLTPADGQESCVGTPRYMPPDGRMDARADVYAAGLTLYELISGLSAESFPRLSPPCISASRDPRFVALNQLVLRASDREYDRRFRDGLEMLSTWKALCERATVRRSISWHLVPAAIAALVALAFVLWLYPRRLRTDVNFVTDPYEAEVHLNGLPVLTPDGRPYTTPCTIPNLPRRNHKVTFRKQGLPELSAGEVDFRSTREVIVKWQTQSLTP